MSARFNFVGFFPAGFRLTPRPPPASNFSHQFRKYGTNFPHRASPLVFTTITTSTYSPVVPPPFSDGRLCIENDAVPLADCSVVSANVTPAMRFLSAPTGNPTTANVCNVALPLYVYGTVPTIIVPFSRKFAFPNVHGAGCPEFAAPAPVVPAPATAPPPFGVALGESLIE